MQNSMKRPSSQGGEADWACACTTTGMHHHWHAASHPRAVAAPQIQQIEWGSGSPTCMEVLPAAAAHLLLVSGLDLRHLGSEKGVGGVKQPLSSLSQCSGRGVELRKR